MNVVAPIDARQQAIDLTVARRGARSILVRQFAGYPFHLTRPFHLDEAVPRLATIYVQSAAGGVYGGDRLRLSLDVEDGAACEVTSQASTIVHDAKGDATRLVQRLTVGADAFAALWPDPTILLPGASLIQSTEIGLADGASAMLADAWMTHDPAGQGRTFVRLEAKTIVRDARGRLLVTDNQTVRGDDWTMALGASDWRAAASVLFLGHRIGAIGTAEIDDTIGAAGALGGGTILPNDAGIGIRFLAKDGAMLSAALERLWQIGFAARFGARPAKRRK